MKTLFLDVLYQTVNRTLLLKTALVDQTAEETNSKVVKIQFWFDRLNNPDNVLIWTTSYEVRNSGAKVEELVKSTLTHPYVQRVIFSIFKPWLVLQAWVLIILNTVFDLTYVKVFIIFSIAMQEIKLGTRLPQVRKVPTSSTFF